MHSQPPQRKPLQPQPDTLQSLLIAMQSRLLTAGVADPGLEASILLEHLTGLDRTSLLRDMQRAASPYELSVSSELLVRRLAGEPVQYIVGKAWFYGREFLVDPRVLIPRPETEMLIDLTKNLPSMLPGGSGEPIIADVGTGSGILAATLALECCRAHVMASDVSPGALRVAYQNCVRHRVQNHVEFIACDALGGISRQFDIIVSNPPYVRSVDMSGLQREVRDFEPQTALDGGDDGLDVVRGLVVQSAAYLRTGGTLLLEVGVGQAGEVTGLMTQLGVWVEVDVVSDLSGIARVVCARRAAS